MTDTPTRRRGHGEDAIYFDAAKNRFVGAISVGFGPGGKRVRRKITGRTKAEVRDRLKAAHAELDRGLHTSASYTVQHAVDDWLEGGLQGPLGTDEVHLPRGAQAAAGAHRHQAAPGADGPRRTPGTRSAQ